MIRLFLKNAGRFPQHFFWWVYGGNVVIENRYFLSPNLQKLGLLFCVNSIHLATVIGKLQYLY